MGARLRHVEEGMNGRRDHAKDTEEKRNFMFCANKKFCVFCALCVPACTPVSPNF